MVIMVAAARVVLVMLAVVMAGVLVLMPVVSVGHLGRCFIGGFLLIHADPLALCLGLPAGEQGRRCQTPNEDLRVFSWLA